MSSNNVYETYGELLKWHNKGYAVWEPLRADEIKVGNVGYFDHHGRWQLVFEDIKDSLHTKPFEKEVTISTTPAEQVRDFNSEHLRIVNIHAGIALEYKLVQIMSLMDTVVQRSVFQDAWD